jgi:DNA polymerase III subunit delta
LSLAADRRLRSLVERGDVEGVFFFHGDAERLRDEAARVLVDAAVDPATRDFNLDSYRASDVSPETLAASLAMPPVMAPRRVVALFGAERLTPTGCGVVERVLERTPPDLTLVVTATIPSGSRKAFYRKMKDGAIALEWTAPREAEIPGWLIERASEVHGIELGSRAAEALAAAVGSDLGLLEAELEKLASTGTGGAVTLERIAELVPNVRPVNRWAWLDSVAERDYMGALAELPVLLSAPDSNAVGLINAMADHHVLLGVAAEGGASLLERTLGEVGKPYLKFKVRTYVAQSRRWTGEEIERALRLFRRADARSKTTGGRDAAVLEELLLGLQVLRTDRDS